MAEILSYRDAPGRQREYETIFILAPETDGEKIQQINDRPQWHTYGQSSGSSGSTYPGVDTNITQPPGFVNPFSSDPTVRSSST